MATFTQGFMPNTSSNGADLTITDTSVYGGSLPKTVFTGRSVTIVKTDNTTQTVNFPYDDMDNSVQDVLTISNFFDKDYYLDITVDWTFSNEGDPDTATLEVQYLSNYNALLCFVTTGDETDCDCDCEGSPVLTKLSNYIESAILWAKYGNGAKSQKFLDACKEICDSLEDCNCNS